MHNMPYALKKSGKPLVYTPPFKSFGLFLTELENNQGKQFALIFNDFESNKTTSFTYAELNKFTVQISFVLRTKFNLRKGNRISFSLNNSPEIILLNYSAWRSGLVSVPLDPRRDTLDRKIYKLKLTKSKILFTRADTKTKKENRAIKKSIPKIKIIEIKNIQDFKLKYFSRSINNKKYTSDHTDDCLVLFTSGTTAQPKGVRLNIKSLFANAESVADWLGIDEKERFYIFLPLHHINAITFTNSVILKKGTLILSSRYSKSGYCDIMAKNHATGSSIVPTIAYDLLSEERSYKKNQNKLRQVKRLQIGSAPVQPIVVEEFMKKYKIPLYQGYGQTETSLRSTGVPTKLTKAQYSKVRNLNSIGTELKYTNVTILNKNNKTAKENEIGEICIRGPIVMTGYLNDSKATQEAFRDGWLHSGDMGYYRTLYGKRFFFMTGRKKEIIKKGGYLISPMAIENTLLKHYKTLEKAYAVGFPDPRVGQEIGVIAISKNKRIVNTITNDIQNQKIRGLPKYEYPKAIVFLNDDELPKTSTGKIQRGKLQEKYG